MSIIADLQALTDERWQDRALCPETDPEIFFLPQGGSTVQARQVCFACPVRLECLWYALTHPELEGIWAGITDRQRKNIRAGHADPEQYWRCRKGHDLTKVGIDSNGRCRQCAADKAERDRQKRAQSRRAAA